MRIKNTFTAVLLFVFLTGISFSQEMLNINLLANPDAENETTDITPGWNGSHEYEPRTEVYGHTGGEFDWDWGKDKGFSNCYFRATILKGEPRYLSQVIDLGSISDLINSGDINYSLGGYFGGGDDATAWMEAVFLNKDGKIISRSSIPLLKDSEKPWPLDLYSRNISGQIPNGTNSTEVFLRFEYYGSCENCYNMAVADNLSFTLNKNTK